MALLDKFDRTNQSEGDPSIAVHTFTAAVNLWAEGDLTRAQVVAGFSLDATDQIQLDNLGTWYTGLSDIGKAGAFRKLESGLILLENGLVGQAFVRSLFTLSA